MKLSTKKILEKIEEIGNWRKIKDFISSLDLTPEQMELLADHENENVRYGLADNSKLTEKVMIKLSNDENMWVRWVIARNPRLKITENVMILLSSDVDGNVSGGAFEKLEKLNSLSYKDLESAYDLIRESKHIRKYRFKETFDYIADELPELSELAKMFKKLILKLKKDLK